MRGCCSSAAHKTILISLQSSSHSLVSALVSEQVGREAFSFSPGSCEQLKWSSCKWWQQNGPDLIGWFHEKRIWQVGKKEACLLPLTCSPGTTASLSPHPPPPHGQGQQMVGNLTTSFPSKIGGGGNLKVQFGFEFSFPKDK